MRRGTTGGLWDQEQPPASSQQEAGASVLQPQGNVFGPSDEDAAHVTPGLQPLRPWQRTHLSQACPPEKINERCLKPLNLWKLVPQQ